MNKSKIKCVVWDLDNTVWDGVLLETEQVQLKEHVPEVIKELDRRGILQSISSKNEFEPAKKKLEEFGLWEYFIYPEINWNAKSQSIESIAKSINIGIDTLAFIDDQEFEREEVNFSIPDVLTIDAADIDKVLNLERMMPTFVTEDSKKRRKLYQTDIVRNNIEKEFSGTKGEFLASLQIKMEITLGEDKDLKRMEELTVRTHQLNSTGYVYSYEELKWFISSDKHEVIVAKLSDKYGDYGKIGLSLIEKKEEYWEIKLLLMSCRVMSKGVGNVMLNYIINLAREHGVSVRAQFVPTDRNRIMYITYKFNGFNEVQNEENLIVFEADTSYERQIPEYITLVGKVGI